MKRIFNSTCLLLILILFTFLISCNTDNSNKQGLKTKVFTLDVLPKQTFTINSERDTTLKGKSGTTLRIYRSTFVSSNGELVKGSIDIEFKEALTPIDIVTSGLTTTSNGHFLESAGMIYINAIANGKPLKILNGKFIGAIVPTKQLKKDMKVFEGKIDSSGINWDNPKTILNDKLIVQRPPVEQKQSPDSLQTVKKKSKGDIDAILDYVESDTIYPQEQKIVRKRNKIKKQLRKQRMEEDVFITEIQMAKGQNQFLEDNNTNYIFSLKMLGWANLDRLYEDPRTKEVELITKVDNQKAFKEIYITLIVTKKSMYIPGYQRKDDTFSFTHNDDEPVELPIGENAIILVTAYKDDKPFYAIRKMTILEKQIISLKLEETTNEKLKAALAGEM